ncbi:hypothetical protein NQ317_011765 [Molorchus minor]|uniref:Septin-type G domain-containing protein n=1 Tax=Molorchus minor TaxID=1323400 RepID=A0ABQ9IVA6_9CUCU|nr:hypothetical protein NQ317_011765 [Molorchus minor]
MKLSLIFVVFVAVIMALTGQAENILLKNCNHKGFDFTLMIVGESGLGKSTLINSMFLTDIYNSDYPGPTRRIKKTTTVEATQVLLKEGGVNLRLTVVDTPGFGDAIDNTGCHSLRAIDIEFMKQLSTKVNIVPIIAKADTLTPEECKEMKIKVLDDIKRHNIRIFEFDDLLKEDDEYELHRTLRDKVPFAVASSNTVVEVDGRNIRGRQYPWGFIEVENLEHCDFKALRKMKLSPIIGSTCQSVADSPNRDHQKARQLQINGLQISERLEILKTEQKKKNEGMVKLLKNNVKEVQKMKFENNKECWKTVIQSQKLSK